MKARFQIFFILTALSGCIGTDYLEDPIVGARIEVFPIHVALMPSQSMQLTATYKALRSRVSSLKFKVRLDVHELRYWVET